jgi:hypothetical protein
MDPTLPVPVIGLTGGIAAGKSHVAAIMRDRGWVILDADQAARDVVGKGTEGLEALVQRFGQGLLKEDGTLDRTGLAQRVFSDPAVRRDLEALLHTRIETHLNKLLKAVSPEAKGAFLGRGCPRSDPDGAASGPGPPFPGTGFGPAGRPNQRRRETLARGLRHME